MIYVKAVTRGPEGHTPVDPVRRDRIPADCWRPTEPSRYWQRLAADGDILLRSDTPPAKEIEGYEPPARAPKADKTAEAESAPAAQPAAGE